MNQDLQNNPRRISFTKASSNGIEFHSSVIPGLYSDSRLDKNGKITSQLVPIVVFAFSDHFSCILNKENDSKSAKRNRTIVLIFDAILVALCIFLLRNVCITLAAIFFSFFVSLRLFNLICNVYNMKAKKGNNHSQARFHAAEHMACNAYESLQRIPTLDEIKNYSRISDRCSTNMEVYDILFYLILSISTFLISIHLLAYLLFGVLSLFLLVKLKRNRDLFNKCQFLTTSKPTDTELNLAIEGLKCLVKAEEAFLSTGFLSFEMSIDT